LKLKIAVDVMGGDNAPQAIIDGVLLAAGNKENSDVQFVLVGQKDIIISHLEGRSYPKNQIEIFNATESIGMDESPVNAVKRKKDSSICRMLDLAKQGKVNAVVSAGNTGAVVVASAIKLRTLEGIDRPAITTVLPRPSGYWILLDAGANAECKPKNLFQFAVMGEVFAREIIGIRNPKAGLMSIGGETKKGNDLTKETLKLMEKVPFNFVGNIEGNDAFTDNVDVIVCDGFVGNVVLKVSESVYSAIKTILKQEIRKKIWAPFIAPLFKSIFESAKQKLDHEEYGGAPLLGIGGTCIIAHGNSTPRAIKNALQVARKSFEQSINEKIVNQVQTLSKTNNG